MRVVERIAGHYDVQDVEFGKVYTWRPESVVAECECGQRATFEGPEIISGSASVCECGKDPTARIREELLTRSLDEEEDDKVLHPWRFWRTSKNTGLPF
jgi:hypothetical protein